MIKSEICQLLGIKYPVFQGGMAWVADGRLASAVSDGGGLGIIAGRQRSRSLCEGADQDCKIIHG